MPDKHVNSFIAAAECGSLSRAAEKLYISKSALSQQIALLERDLDLKLLERTSKGIRLTRSGELFYYEAKKLQMQFEEMLDRCHSVDGENTLRIGVSSTFYSPILIDLCKIYKMRYPDRRIIFIASSDSDYYKDFQNHLFDITIEYMTNRYFQDENLCRFFLKQTRHLIGLSPSHPLARKKELTPTDLTDQEILLNAKGINEADDKLRDIFMQTIPYPRITDIYRYDRYLAAECLLSNKVLVCYAGYEDNFPELITIPLSGVPDIPIDLCYYYHQNPAEEILDFLNIAEECRG